MGKIEDSKGNVYPCTWADLQKAIYVAEEDCGTVWVKGNINANKTLVTGKFVTVDFLDNFIFPQDNFNIIDLRQNSQIRNAIFDARDITFDKAFIWINGEHHQRIGLTGIDNIRIVNKGVRGIGVYFDCSKPHTNIHDVTINKLKTNDLDTSILMDVTGGGGDSHCWCNSNVITDTFGVKERYHVKMIQAEEKSAIGGNWLWAVRHQTRYCSVTPFYCDGRHNQIYCFPWDWWASDHEHAVILTDKTYSNRVFTCLNSVDILDEGRWNEIHTYRPMYVDEIRPNFLTLPELTNWPPGKKNGSLVYKNGKLYFNLNGVFKEIQFVQ